MTVDELIEKLTILKLKGYGLHPAVMEDNDYTYPGITEVFEEQERVVISYGYA